MGCGATGSCTWFGEVTDLTFPQIAPSASAEEVAALAADYERQVLAMGSPADITVHLMGEQTFCFALLTRLLAANVRCVASCTVRGTFEFEQFREYVV